jgi:hypothetical protein
MLRRVIVTAALMSCIVTSAWAQDRATYVLSNGEKHNGVIVYGRGDNNIVDGKFHVNKSGVDLVFEPQDVVVIDFVGGTPNAAERRSLPADNTPVMVMRDGTVHRGHLHNILKPVGVQWVNEGGQRNNFPIADVRRLYLNPERARNVFLDSSTGTTGAAPLPGGIGARPGVAVRVEGNQQWVDTGLDVRRGDRLVLNATGQIEYAPGGNTATPAGGRSRSPNHPVPAMGSGGLIARIGDSAPVAVGAGSRTITASRDGRLFLGINDDDVSDNSGAFTVSVRRQ